VYVHRFKQYEQILGVCTQAPVFYHIQVYAHTPILPVYIHLHTIYCSMRKTYYYCIPKYTTTAYLQHTAIYYYNIPSTYYYRKKKNFIASANCILHVFRFTTIFYYYMRVCPGSACVQVYYYILLLCGYYYYMRPPEPPQGGEGAALASQTPLPHRYFQPTPI
jgi:hypothetical protein